MVQKPLLWLDNAKIPRLIRRKAAGEALRDGALQLRQRNRRMLDQRQHRLRERWRKLQHRMLTVRRAGSIHPRSTLAGTIAASQQHSAVFS